MAPYRLPYSGTGLPMYVCQGMHVCNAVKVPCAIDNGLTTEDALAVDGDRDRVAVHVRHTDTQQFKVIVQVPDTNVLIAACSNQL